MFYENPLEQFLVSELFAFLMIFCRTGTGIMVLPGFGESYVNARSRLLFALMLALVLTPALTAYMPPIPDSPASLAALIAAEMLVGLSIGMVCRIIISSIHVAGMIISTNASLAMATQFDPNQAAQGSLIGSFLSISAVVLMFTMDLHYVMLRGMADSYSLFTPGTFPPVGDLALYFSQLVADIFMLGFKLSAPATIVALLLYLGAGVLSRLMPNMQVFFILLPPQIFLSIFMLASVYAAILLQFTGFFTERFEAFLDGPVR